VAIRTPRPLVLTRGPRSAARDKDSTSGAGLTVSRRGPGDDRISRISRHFASTCVGHVPPLGMLAGVSRGRHDDLQAREARQFLLADVESGEVSELELYRACDVYDVQGSAADRASVLATQLTRSF
jgi:hypothetical protein